MIVYGFFMVLFMLKVFVEVIEDLLCIVLIINYGIDKFRFLEFV